MTGSHRQKAPTGNGQIDSQGSATAWRPQRPGRSIHHPVRGLSYHLRCWAPDEEALPGQAPPAAAQQPGLRQPLLFLLHGWMDVSASFQFVVDALPRHWRILAPDWRGFGRTQRAEVDCYWFPDYLADLDALLDAFAPDEPVDLVGHSMGGNVALLYGGVRPQRVRRIIDLDGLGVAPTHPDQAPDRYAQWLDALRAGPRLRDYPSRAAVAARLQRLNPRLPAGRAAFLAEHWSQESGDGRFRLLSDPAHRLPLPTLYRVDETLACWRRIEADVLLVLAGLPDERAAFTRAAEWRERWRAIRSLRKETIAGAGHMLHHERPQEVARLITQFLSAA